MRSVFWATFFNSGLIMIIATFDFRKNEKFLYDFFSGLYVDVNSYWFRDVGFTVVSAMIINMFYPIIEFFLFWALRHLYRMKD